MIRPIDTEEIGTMGDPNGEIPIHLVGALYPTEQTAQYALSRLEQAGFARERIYLVGNPAPSLQGVPAPSTTDVANLEEFLGMVRADLLQAGAGAEAGLADAASVSAKKVRVYAAKPVLQTLLALGHNTLFGLAEDSRKIVEVTEDEFSQLVRDTVNSEHWAVVVRPEDDQKAQQALELLGMVYD